MGFTVIENEVRTLWVALDSSSVFYKGQIVSIMGNGTAKTIPTGGTISPLMTGAGAADITNWSVPFGVILGFDDRTPVYSTTYAGLEQCTGIITQAAQISRLNTGTTGVEGMYSKGDAQPHAQVAVISPLSVLRGNIWNATYGVAPQVSTASAASTDGWATAGTVTGTIPFVNVAQYGSIYCRTGANAGLTRKLLSTSGTTAPQVTVEFQYDIAIGDTFVAVPFSQGYARINILPTNVGLFVNQAATPATNYFEVIVWKYDLSVAGSEYVDFSFLPTHFSGAAAHA